MTFFFSPYGPVVLYYYRRYYDVSACVIILCVTCNLLYISGQDLPIVMLELL